MAQLNDDDDEPQGLEEVWLAHSYTQQQAKAAREHAEKALRALVDTGLVSSDPRVSAAAATYDAARKAVQIFTRPRKR